MGKINAISTSKIKKIIVIRKKCKENGIRAIDLGSNPHSNGEHFSRSMNDFFEIIKEIIIKILAIIITIINNINIKKIIYIKIIKLFDWKSNILNILYK